MVRRPFSNQQVMWTIQLGMLRSSFQSAEGEQVKGRHSMTKTRANLSTIENIKPNQFSAVSN